MLLILCYHCQCRVIHFHKYVDRKSDEVRDGGRGERYLLRTAEESISGCLTFMIRNGTGKDGEGITKAAKASAKYK